MHNLVVGYGEIGKALKVVLGEPVSIADLKHTHILSEPIDVMHVCFPYSENFEDSLNGYIDNHKPKHIVIYSTVPIGTTKKFPRAVHSFVEGNHPNLEDSIRLMERWIGYNDKEEGQFFANLFRDLGLRVKQVENSDYTEALKLLSTTEYGINIEFARYKKYIADSIGMDYELCKEFNAEYNKLYKDLGMATRYQKFVLDAPDGPKGGHCVTPNAKLLHQQYPSELTKIVGEL